MITYDDIDIQLPLLYDLGIKNLLVSGCSFTRNPHGEHAITWPLLLKSSIGADKVYDCSLPGAGNYHISHSLIWEIETHDLNPSDTLVVVMWSGNNRDDAIVDSQKLKKSYAYQYYYSSDVASAISGGDGKDAQSNVDPEFSLSKLKNQQSRAIENYLYIISTWHYLQSRKYRTVFTEFTDRSTPARIKDFDIRKHLPRACQKKLNLVMAKNLTDIYSWSLKRNELSEDDFHPNHYGNLSWVQQVLVPWLKNNSPIVPV